MYMPSLRAEEVGRHSPDVELGRDLDKTRADANRM